MLIAVAALVVLLFDDALNLSFTLNRVTEFGHERSSGYIRYLAPMQVIWESINAELWTPWVGHGPGTIQRSSHRIEFFDPTWAKLLFEYGALGFAVFCALIVYALKRFNAPTQIRAMLFFSWLVMGSHLLSPENLVMLYAICCSWPRSTPGAA